MPVRVDRIGRKIYNAQQRMELLNAFSQSGLSKADFADQHGLQHKTFAGWFRERADQSSTGSSQQITFRELSVSSMSNSSVVIETPKGYRVQLPQVTSTDLVGILQSL